MGVGEGGGGLRGGGEWHGHGHWALHAIHSSPTISDGTFWRST